MWTCHLTRALLGGRASWRSALLNTGALGASCCGPLFRVGRSLDTWDPESSPQPGSLMPTSESTLLRQHPHSGPPEVCWASTPARVGGRDSGVTVRLTAPSLRLPLARAVNRLASCVTWALCPLGQLLLLGIKTHAIETPRDSAVPHEALPCEAGFWGPVERCLCRGAPNPQGAAGPAPWAGVEQDPEETSRPLWQLP